MMTLEKELTQDQLNDVEKLGQLKQNLPHEKWVLFRTLMLTYINGFEAGLSMGQDTHCKRPRLEINPADPGHRQKDYLSLAVLFQIPLDTVKDNYETLVGQCKEAGIIY